MPQGPIPTLISGLDPDKVAKPINVDDNGNLIVAASGGGEAVTIADGADATQGAKADTAWVSGAGSVVALLKNIAGALAGVLNVTNSPSGASAYNTNAAQAGHQVKTGPGVFNGFSTNTAGTGTTATLYDGTSTGGVKLATINTAAQGSLIYNIGFTTGLFIVATAGSGAADITVAYH